MTATLTLDWIGAPPNVGALSTLRDGGVSSAPYDDGASGNSGLNLAMHVGDAPENVQRNRALLRSFIPSEPAWLTQVHGTQVVNAESVNDTPEADASITNKRSIVCAVLTADCLPVLFCDAAGTIVAAAHAGWRGLANGVLEQTVQHMRDAGASNILAWLGPAIGPQKFEVGEDVRQAFANHGPISTQAFHPIQEQSGKYLANIYTLAKNVLGNVGVTHISGGNYCTVTDTKRFYSFRRDNITGRMASLIWLK